jgi:excisionase family DNA binding protein
MMIQSITPAPPATDSSDFAELLTPKEVCALLKIERTTFERWKRNDFITVLKAQIGRKVYVSKSELMSKFPKHFINV